MQKPSKTVSSVLFLLVHTILLTLLLLRHSVVICAECSLALCCWKTKGLLWKRRSKSCMLPSHMCKLLIQFPKFIVMLSWEMLFLSLHTVVNLVHCYLWLSLSLLMFLAADLLLMNLIIWETTTFPVFCWFLLSFFKTCCWHQIQISHLQRLMSLY